MTKCHNVNQYFNKLWLSACFNGFRIWSKHTSFWSNNVSWPKQRLIVIDQNTYKSSSILYRMGSLQNRVGRNIEKKIRYYWTSVLEFFSVFNSIEISVLNIFNIQYYWTVLLIFSVIPKYRKYQKSLKIL